MDRLHEGIGLGLILGVLHGLLQSAQAIPVVPNFQQGSMTSRTETTTKVTEVINSMDYNTGFQYSVTGSNIKHSGASISPGTATGNSNTVNGVTTTWTGLDLKNKPDWSLVTPGAAFQFTETYQGSGLSNHTVVERTTEIQSVTETTSIFTQ
jgi:hypothetical protein